MPTFGQLLKAERGRLQLSQEHLAALLKVSQQAVARWEADITQPRRHRRAKLMEIVGPKSPLVAREPMGFHVEAELPESSREEANHHDSDDSVMRGTHHHPPTSHSSIHGLLAQRKRDQDEFQRHLPIPLRGHCQRMISVGATSREMDYLSPRVCAEIKRGSNPANLRNVAAPALLNLAVVRSIASTAHRTWALIIVDEDMATRADAPTRRLALDAGLLGIHVYHVEGFDKAAEMVVALENQPNDAPLAHD